MLRSDGEISVKLTEDSKKWRGTRRESSLGSEDEGEEMVCPDEDGMLVYPVRTR